MTNCRNVELLLSNMPNFTYGYNIPLYIIYFFNLVKELSFPLCLTAQSYNYFLLFSKIFS